MKTNFDARKHSGKNAVWIIRSLVLITALALGCAVLWIRQDAIPFGIASRGIAVIFLALAPGLIYLANPNKSSFPLFSMNCAFYALAVGFGVFRKINDPRYSVSDATIEETLSMTILGLAIQIGVYAIILGLVRRGEPLRLCGQLDSASLALVGWIFIGIRLAQIAIPALNDIPSFSQFANLCGLAGAAIIFSLRNLGTVSKINLAVLYFGIIPVEIVARATTGSIANVMTFCMLFIVCRWALQRKVAWVFLVLLVFGYVVLAPLKNQYRLQVWNEDSTSNTITAKAWVYWQLIEENWIRGERSGTDSEVEDSIDRFNILPLMCLVVEQTPNRVPYWSGETLRAAATTFIPRIIWNDKPTQTIGNEFGHRYEILGPTDTGTSINLPWIVELYANFGYSGIAVGMAIFGALFALIEKKSGEEKDNPIDRLLLISLTLGLTYPESNITLMWGGLILNTFAVYCSCRIAAMFLSRTITATRTSRRYS